MNRRAFLTAVAAAIPAFGLDPERLLWRPGQRSYFDIVKPVSPGWTLSGALTKGDILTIQGVFAVNPITREETGHLMQFVVLDDVQGIIEPAQMWPHMRGPGDPYQTVSRVPTSDDALGPLWVGQTVAEYRA